MPEVNSQYPENNIVSNTFQPSFGFHYTYQNVTNIGIQVSSTPDMLTIVVESNRNIDPDEWLYSEYGPDKTINFVFPDDKLVEPNGTYYWQVWVWDSVLAAFFLSDVRTIVIADAVYHWQMGSPLIRFRPARGGITVETIQVGCQNLEKHIFRVEFAPMQESDMQAIKAVYDTRRFTLRDNHDDSYVCYWGECDRNVAGTAFPAKNPEFGIGPINNIPGALRWGGAAIFTEE